MHPDNGWKHTKEADDVLAEISIASTTMYSIHVIWFIVVIDDVVDDVANVADVDVHGVVVCCC
jgi:hypothetical protein